MGHTMRMLAKNVGTNVGHKEILEKLDDGVFVRTLQCLAAQQQKNQNHGKEPSLMPVPSPQQISYLNQFEGNLGSSCAEIISVTTRHLNGSAYDVLFFPTLSSTRDSDCLCLAEPRGGLVMRPLVSERYGI